MSTILEALKKSEQERKLNSLPTLNDMPPPQEASKWPLYLAVAILVLALAIAVLAYVWWSSNKNAALGNESSASLVARNPEPTPAKESPLEALVDDSVTVNVVSYSDNVSERFAMINGKMVREGEFVRAGLQVVEIRKTTVVLNLRGKRLVQGP